MAAYTNGMIFRFIVREFIVGLVVAVVVASLVYLFMNKRYKRHYWLLTFFPAVISSKLPDIVIALGALMSGGLSELKNVARHPGISIVHEMVHSPILMTVLTTAICLSIVLLWARFVNKKIVLPKHWKWYVMFIACVSVLIEIMVLDPLPF